MKEILINLNQRPIAVYPIYIKLTGSVNAGLLLSQIMYWYSAVKGRKFYKSDAEIMEETMLSLNELRGAKSRLKELPFIMITLHGIPAKTHYDINVVLLINAINENTLVKSTKLNKLKSQKYNSEINECNTENTTDNTSKNTTDISFQNLPDFTDFTKVETNDFTNVQSPKVNPFTVVAKLQSEKERKIVAAQKERKADAEPKAERQPSPTYAAFSVFCQTFENLSGAAYPTDQNGHYIMMPKDAGQMGNLLKYIDKIDRQGDSLEALKVFIQAAWNLNDKWLRANFTIANLYSQASKIFTAYQTTSPAAKDKAYNDRIQELLAERMAKFQD
jgi:hypothetical protein